MIFLKDATYFNNQLDYEPVFFCVCMEKRMCNSMKIIMDKMGETHVLMPDIRPDIQFDIWPEIQPDIWPDIRPDAGRMPAGCRPDAGQPDALRISNGFPIDLPKDFPMDLRWN